jgi:hypothetical protein
MDIQILFSISTRESTNATNTAVALNHFFATGGPVWSIVIIPGLSERLIWLHTGSPDRLVPRAKLAAVRPRGKPSQFGHVRLRWDSPKLLMKPIEFGQQFVSVGA